MGLDVNTPKGQNAITQVRRGLSLIGRNYVETPQDTTADVDGYFLNSDGDRLAAVFEAKAREMSLSDLRGKFSNEWLLTYEKLVKGAATARANCIPFFGVVYLVPDDLTLLVRITDCEGNIVVPFRADVTMTRATVNGGLARRTNAYISMDSAQMFREKASATISVA